MIVDRQTHTQRHAHHNTPTNPPIGGGVMRVYLSRKTILPDKPRQRIEIKMGVGDLEASFKSHFFKVDQKPSKTESIEICTLPLG